MQLPINPHNFIPINHHNLVPINHHNLLPINPHNLVPIKLNLTHPKSYQQPPTTTIITSPNNNISSYNNNRYHEVMEFIISLDEINTMSQSKLSMVIQGLYDDDQNVCMLKKLLTKGYTRNAIVDKLFWFIKLRKNSNKENKEIKPDQ